MDGRLRSVSLNLRAPLAKLGKCALTLIENEGSYAATF